MERLLQNLQEGSGPQPLNTHSASNKKHNKLQVSIINTLSPVSKLGIHPLVVIYLVSAHLHVESLRGIVHLMSIAPFIPLISSEISTPALK